MRPLPRRSCAVNKDLAGTQKGQRQRRRHRAWAIRLAPPGARVLTTLLLEMQKRNAKKGLATLCIGGGMGIALTVER